MAEIICGIIGVLLLLITIYDFFFTTLAQSGAGWVTKLTLRIAHRLLNISVSVFGRGAYSLSGLLINLVILVVWICLVWVGLFLLFSSNPAGITHTDGTPADLIERLYFTGFVISTLGIGDYTPVTDSFQMLVSCFSFFGFIFFTTSMTYLVSVTSAVIHKRSLASSIYFLGHHPAQIIQRFRTMDPIQFKLQLSDLQQMMDKQSINLQAFPALHYYCTYERSVSLGINLTVLDESLSRISYTHEGNGIRENVVLLRKSISDYLKHLEENFSHIVPDEPEIQIELPDIAGSSETSEVGEMDLDHRRTILTGILRAESFGWSDIYS